MHISREAGRGAREEGRAKVGLPGRSPAQRAVAPAKLQWLPLLQGLRLHSHPQEEKKVSMAFQVTIKSLPMKGGSLYFQPPFGAAKKSV